VPSVDGLSFSYVLHELPAGRLPFRRWRFELWHGARLEAAGWRVTERDAACALRTHGARVGRRLFGLPAPAPTPDRSDTPAFWPGRTVHVEQGSVRFELVPRNLEAPPSEPAARSARR
jgi:hypothetical protein